MAINEDIRKTLVDAGLLHEDDKNDLADAILIYVGAMTLKGIKYHDLLPPLRKLINAMRNNYGD